MSIHLGKLVKDLTTIHNQYEHKYPEIISDLGYLINSLESGKYTIDESEEIKHLKQELSHVTTSLSLSRADVSMYKDTIQRLTEERDELRDQLGAYSDTRLFRD